MAHAHTSRVQEYIGDPVSDSPPVDRETLEEIFNDIQSDIRYDHELNGCLNCGICTATCPAAHYYDFSPREIVQLLWTENLEAIYDAMQEKIWACAQCYTCAARCPFNNSPGGLVMLMREAAIKHGMESAKNVLRPFSRVMLKLISTGNQLSPDMINPEGFADWGPNISKVDAPLKLLRQAIPMLRQGDQLACLFPLGTLLTQQPQQFAVQQVVSYRFGQAAVGAQGAEALYTLVVRGIGQHDHRQIMDLPYLQEQAAQHSRLGRLAGQTHDKQVEGFVPHPVLGEGL